MAVGYCPWLEGVFGLGEGLDLSVTVAGDERGLGLGFSLDVEVRRFASADAGVTVRPGVVTSDVVVVVVVVVSLG